jgi:hypothetical protein
MDRELGTQPLQRYSFVLSLWSETGPHPHSPRTWRTSLEDPLTSRRWGFKDLPELMRFLERWTSEPQPSELEK